MENIWLIIMIKFLFAYKFALFGFVIICLFIAALFYEQCEDPAATTITGKYNMKEYGRYIFLTLFYMFVAALAVQIIWFMIYTIFGGFFGQPVHS